MYIYINISLNSSYNEKYFRKKIVEKIKTHILYAIIFSSEKDVIYEIMWGNMVQPGRPQMTM
jgi:hypothetical protein